MANFVLCQTQMLRFRLLLLATSFQLMAFSQEAGRNTVTFGAGGGFPSGGYRTAGLSDSAAFSASYEFRLFKYLAPEAGVLNMIPNVLNNSEFGLFTSRERVTLLSLGVRGIAPLGQGRVELFAGAGAAHLWSSDQELVQGFQSPTWLLQINGGGQVAIDHRRRFWIGPVVRFSRDGGRPTEEWVSLTGDFGFRF
jgi:hypothetical protein